MLAVLRRHEQTYRHWLEQFKQHLPALHAISASPDVAGTEPTFANPYFGVLDATALYGFVAELRPATLVEIGSGYSTRFAQRCIRDRALATRFLCIDPEPRVHVAGGADLVRMPLEQVDVAMFDALRPDDIVFLDGSHRCGMNSDVTVFFLDILPRLPRGVVVHLHDIWWPSDYPADWADREYNEQYLLAALLLGRAPLDILLPNMYVCRTPELFEIVAPLWDDPKFAGRRRDGGSFWFRWGGLKESTL